MKKQSSVSTTWRSELILRMKEQDQNKTFFLSFQSLERLKMKMYNMPSQFQMGSKNTCPFASLISQVSSICSIWENGMSGHGGGIYAATRAPKGLWLPPFKLGLLSLYSCFRTLPCRPKHFHRTNVPLCYMRITGYKEARCLCVQVLPPYLTGVHNNRHKEMSTSWRG